MRTTVPDRLEAGRILLGNRIRKSDGMRGSFRVVGPLGRGLFVTSYGPDYRTGWEHVAVSMEFADRTPIWAEICFVKDLFWDDEECAMQLHPPRSEYVSCDRHTLHIWRTCGSRDLRRAQDRQRLT